MANLDSPTMSDNTLLVSVEDLINIAMGPSEKNVVNYKMLQTVLHILARQMRMLEQRVEIRISEQPLPREKEKKVKSPRHVIREERSREKPASKPESRDRERDRIEKEKESRALSKDRERAEREKEKQQQKEEKVAAKDREREARSAEREKRKDDRRASKERERETRSAERDKRAASKEREKEVRSTERDKIKGEKAEAKEREREAKSAERETRSAEREARLAEREARSAEREARSAEREARSAEREARSAERDKKKDEKAISKEREREARSADRAEKDRKKEEKASSKEKEIAEREKVKAEHLWEKERARGEKEKEKEIKEKEKAAAREAKEKEKQEKTSTKEKEESAKEMEKEEKAAKRRKGKGREDSATKIAISEVEREKQKVLVVEKGPTTRSDVKSRTSIDVVTRSQFELLETMVKELSVKAGPLPTPALPDNKKLRSDLAKGTASLTDTMNAMQVNARVQAAEQAINRMSDLLTQLAASGALPEDIAGQVDEVKAGLETQPAGVEPAAKKSKTSAIASRKSVAIDPGAKPSPSVAAPTVSAASGLGPRPSVAAAASTAGGLGRPSVTARPSMASRMSIASGVTLARVTHPEMDDAIQCLREELTKNMQAMTAKANAAAETAVSLAKSVAEKLETALSLDKRISTLYSLTSDYAEQLSGFDSGLTSQMQGFQQQMVQMRTELQQGLTLLEQVNSNAETAAVMELTQRYEGLVNELDLTLHTHAGLTSTQSTLGDQLHNLVESVEMLREQKADRDEVLDGLRDKADNSKLAGLLTEVEFAKARRELENRLEVCHDKFRRQDGVWMGAIKDLKQLTESKAELVEMLGVREEAQQQLRELHEMCKRLALVLGEPKAAMLTRQLSRGAACGACLAPALMEPQDAGAGAPPPLPAALPHPRPDPAGAPAHPCLSEWKLPEAPDDRTHICYRWCGGSHTLLSESVLRQQAPPPALPIAPTKKYTGYGTDGRLYMLEEDLKPCLECNRLASEPQTDVPPPPSEEGACDQGDKVKKDVEEVVNEVI